MQSSRCQRALLPHPPHLLVYACHQSFNVLSRNPWSQCFIARFAAHCCTEPVTIIHESGGQLMSILKIYASCPVFLAFTTVMVLEPSFRTIPYLIKVWELHICSKRKMGGDGSQPLTLFICWQAHAQARKGCINPTRKMFTAQLDFHESWCELWKFIYRSEIHSQVACKKSCYVLGWTFVTWLGSRLGFFYCYNLI